MNPLIKQVIYFSYIPEYLKDETYYTKNLKFAKNFFREDITALYESEGVEGVNELYLKLTQRLMFNIHEIDYDYDVFVAFETMNNRGKKLTNLELLRIV